jgi:hypothetical protein
MKQKIVLLVVVIGVIGAFAALQVSAGVAAAVPIPGEINLFLEGVIFAAVTAGFAFVFQWLGLDLRGLATPISALLSGWVLGELQGWINTLEAFDPYISVAFRIIVVILSGIGTLYVIARQRKQDVANQGLI